MNWANRLTITRIVFVPVFILSILYHRLDIAFVIFLVAAITDGLDGYIARTRNEKTRFGAVLDPIADKLLVGSAFICLSIVTGLPEYLKMPTYVPLVVISRDVIILIGALVIYLLAGKIDIKPTVLGKLTTVFQMSTIILVLLRFHYSSWMWNIAVVFTVISGLDYLRIGAKQVNEKAH
ncbi:MAG: CDP-diacylglycerol--glycerol-3-phosphate 3-phosphatidyltransferase [Candidatus Omnitrophica bacterium]|nr:CDP-diacylglycerol--glycerol-3-phosphate 3-phosphatidyltransferase [Candidatus Omnitrophota bacterium]MBU1128632.1 CDP-diacylglycerol--glycerol-3-phosphate 3-phosphatidyltransferase [Candidatus Omnitrophota bacterium]MBU1657132.1 CDP-diacylglycerol--glycerol-3-phosphate 3-phosphatidyltransferase [Candidatus Omnitrophota bacterium]MBU1785013.1 CDP-diacylglycerol--glycerol-3-phosphate 3-phosphatidyltransferase [Candidatus Omnitrophota bacterium]MBU1852238.1 CDP-diacylglycerol--glycerol-3-phosp